MHNVSLPPCHETSFFNILLITTKLKTLPPYLLKYLNVGSLCFMTTFNKIFGVNFRDV